MVMNKVGWAVKHSVVLPLPLSPESKTVPPAKNFIVCQGKGSRMKSLSFVLMGRDDRSSISEEPHRGHRKISGAGMG